MGDRETRIRDEAYRIWVEAGRPDGDDHRYWYEAEKRVDASDRSGGKTRTVRVVAQSAANAGVAAPVAKPVAKSAAKPGKGAPVDVAPAKGPKSPSRKPTSKPTSKPPSKPKA